MDFSHWLGNVLGHLKLRNAARAQCIFLQSATRLFSMPGHAFLTSSLTDVPDWSGWLAACATLHPPTCERPKTRGVRTQIVRIVARVNVTRRRVRTDGTACRLKQSSRLVDRRNSATRFHSLQFETRSTQDSPRLGRETRWRCFDRVSPLWSLHPEAQRKARNST